MQYSKMPYTSENSFIHNGSIEKVNKRWIDLNWYIKEVNNLIFWRLSRVLDTSEEWAGNKDI